MGYLLHFVLHIPHTLLDSLLVTCWHQILRHFAHSSFESMRRCLLCYVATGPVRPTRLQCSANSGASAACHSMQFTLTEQPAEPTRHFLNTRLVGDSEMTDKVRNANPRHLTCIALLHCCPGQSQAFCRPQGRKQEGIKLHALLCKCSNAYYSSRAVLQTMKRDYHQVASGRLPGKLEETGQSPPLVEIPQLQELRTDGMRRSVSAQPVSTLSGHLSGVGPC